MQTRTLDLGIAATAEAKRLALVRAVTPTARAHGCDALAARRALVARARGARRRQQLGGHVLLVWLIACEDASGRTAGESIVAMTVDVVAPVGVARASWLRHTVRAWELQPPAAIETALGGEQQGLAAACLASAHARLARERAIQAHANALAAAARRPFQAGLFDRRSERRHRVVMDDAVDRERAAEARVRDATAAASLCVAQPRVLLALTA